MVLVPIPMPLAFWGPYELCRRRWGIRQRGRRTTGLPGLPLTGDAVTNGLDGWDFGPCRSSAVK